MTTLALLGALLMPDAGMHRPLKPWPPSPIEGEHYPLFITGYSWDQEVDSMGCDSDCSVTAIGFPTSPDLFGKVAACPSEPREDSWVYTNMVRYIWIDGWGGVWCIDTFGDEEYRTLRWMVGVGWVYHIDLALEDPYSAPYGVHYNYTLDWQWVTTVGCYSCLE